MTMMNDINVDKLLDEHKWENFPTKYNYKDIFEHIALKKITNSEKIELYRELCKQDIYFLLRYAMNREDVQHEWLYARMNEIRELDTEFLFLAARGHYKSTIGTFALTIQDILRDPNQTFCIFSVTDTIANPFLKQISEEFKTNDFLRSIFPEIIPDENSKMLGYEVLRVKRDCNKKEQTVESSGVTTKMPTSRHYDNVIYDDLVTPETANDQSIIESTKDRFRMSLNCVATRYKIRIFGTPYHFSDTYNMIEQLGIYKVLKYPCYDESGEPVFMSREDIERKRDIMGNWVFNSQMLLDPSPIDEATFDTTAIQYEDNIPDKEKLARKMMVILDPAISSKSKSDYCVCMVIESFMYNGLLYLYVHDYFHIKEGNKNPTLVLNRLVDFCLKYKCNNPIIETVAYQESLMYRLREINEERHLKINAIQYKPTTNKQARILALDPIVNFGRLIINPRFKDKEIEQQMRAFPHGHDDHLDCIATANIYAPKIYTNMQPINNVDRNSKQTYNSVRVINNHRVKGIIHNGYKKGYGSIRVSK